MKARLALLAGTVAVTGLAGIGHAAPACNLVTDDKGDAALVGPEGNDPGLDVVSADVASDAKSVTAAIRVEKLATTNLRAAGGQVFYFLFSPKGGANKLYLNASISAAGAATFGFGEYVVTATSGSYTALGTAEGVIDMDKNEVRITAPIAGFAGKGELKPGSKMTDLEASTTARGGVVVFTVDDAVGTKPYTAGDASCVQVGK